MLYLVTNRVTPKTWCYFVKCTKFSGKSRKIEIQDTNNTINCKNWEIFQWIKKIERKIKKWRENDRIKIIRITFGNTFFHQKFSKFHPNSLSIYSMIIVSKSLFRYINFYQQKLVMLKNVLPSSISILDLLLMRFIDNFTDDSYRFDFDTSTL
jgi:hypothetical protein